MTQTDAIVSSLKRAMKSAGLTYADLATHLHLSEASIKRMFHKRSFSLQRLERACGLIGIDIAELTANANATAQRLSTLTREQELTLLEKPKLILMIYLLLNQWDYRQIVSTFDVDAKEAQGLIKELANLGMLEIRPNGGVKLLTARNFRWHPKGPVQRFFRQEVHPDFFRDAFDAEQASLHFVGARLSQASYATIQRDFDKLLATLDDLARNDARLPVDQLVGCGALLAIRPWEFSVFTKLRRQQQQ
ncbi:MAG: helix-turn-helix transcriptional regulator [Pseudomonadota bacterium]